MQFSDRFLELPINLHDPRAEDLMGKTGAMVPSTTKLLPSQLEEYHPVVSVDTGEPVDGTVVYTKTARSFVVTIGVREFERRLNEHQS